MWNKIKEFFSKIWNWIKEHWIALLAIIGSLFTFIFHRQSKRNRISNRTKELINNNRSTSRECSESIVNAREENIRSGERIESSKRIVEDIKSTNESISGEIGSTRAELQSTIDRLDEHIKQLQSSKEN